MLFTHIGLFFQFLGGGVIMRKIFEQDDEDITKTTKTLFPGWDYIPDVVSAYFSLGASSQIKAFSHVTNLSEATTLKKKNRENNKNLISKRL